jgi:threonine dehydrogenase-like Zn-dependent dehydrogenase
MKASVLTGPKRCETMDLPDPSTGGDLAVIRISACGICGSDTHYWELGVGMDGNPGLVLGHEFSGRIADPGSL